MSRLFYGLTIPVLLAFSACASDPSRQAGNRSQPIDCGPGKTLICEVRNTGRIKHGSFGNDAKNCSCEEGRAGPTRVPSIDQY